MFWSKKNKTRKTICQLDTACIMTRFLIQNISFISYRLGKGCNLTTTSITQAEAPQHTSLTTFFFFIITFFKVKKTKRGLTFCFPQPKAVFLFNYLPPIKK